MFSIFLQRKIPNRFQGRSRIPAVSPVMILTVLFCLLAGPATCPADDTGPIFTIQFENDFFGGGTDRHFTHGTRLTYLTRPIPWLANAADRLPWFDMSRAQEAPAGGHALRARGSLELGQNIYTPEDTSDPLFIPDDRPYAGWLYLGFGLVANQGGRRFDRIHLNIGVVGPLSLAEEVQRGWHSMLDIPVPRGWDNQLKNEPGVVLFYEQARRLCRARPWRRLSFDCIPHFGAALGNVFTYGSAGLSVRLGKNLTDDFGPPRIRPSLPGSSCFRPGRGFNWYFFAGVEGRGVLRNIFLDGNTFRHSHSVSKKHWVADLQAGIAVGFRRVRITYTQILRTREFHGQDTPDQFGSLSISYHF